MLRLSGKLCKTYRSTDVADTVFEVNHVNLLLLPWLLGLLKFEELVEDIFVWHDTRVTPFCTSFLAAWLPLHLFLDLCCTHITCLLYALGNLLFASDLTRTSAAAALLKR